MSGGGRFCRYYTGCARLGLVNPHAARPDRLGGSLAIKRSEGTIEMTGMLAATFTQIAMGMALGFVCILLMMIILIQKGRGGGLAGAFGGGGGGGGAFGAKTGDVFTGITVVLAFVFLLLTVFGNYIMRPENAGTASRSVSSAPVIPASGVVPDDSDSSKPVAGTDAPVAVTIPTEKPDPSAPVEDAAEPPTEEAP